MKIFNILYILQNYNHGVAGYIYLKESFSHYKKLNNKIQFKI